MKICVTAEGSTVESNVDSRFGRCRFFIFLDTDTGKFEAVANTNAQYPSGAGIQSAQLVSSHGAEAVLSGSVGPNAFQTLGAGGIHVYTGVSGTVKEAVEALKSGKLQRSESPSVGSKFGMGK